MAAYLIFAARVRAKRAEADRKLMDVPTERILVLVEAIQVNIYDGRLSRRRLVELDTAADATLVKVCRNIATPPQAARVVPVYSCTQVLACRDRHSHIDRIIDLCCTYLEGRCC